MVDKKRKQVKKQRKDKKTLIFLVGLLIVIAVAAAVMFGALKNPEKDTMRKCIAAYSIYYDKASAVFDKPASEKGFEYAREWCKKEKKKYSNENDFEADVNNIWQKEADTVIDGHDRNWYYNQVKL